MAVRLYSLTVREAVSAPNKEGETRFHYVTDYPVLSKERKLFETEIGYYPWGMRYDSSRFFLTETKYEPRTHCCIMLTKAAAFKCNDTVFSKSNKR